MLSYVRALRDWARERPEDLAVIGPDITLSAGELWDTALRIVGWLRDAGVRSDEAVGAAVPPSLHPAFLVALLARGGIGSLVSGDIEAGADAPLQRLITVGEGHPNVARDALLLFDNTAIGRMSTLDPAAITVASPAPDDIVWFMYSSGTTGTPKAVMRSASGMEGFATHRRIQFAKSAYMSLQQGTFAGSLAAFLCSLLVRRRHVSAGTAEQNLQLLLTHSIEATEGSPFQLDKLLTAARRAGERLPALRELHSTGAPLSDGLAAALADWFGAEVYDGYGSSETGFVASRRADDPTGAGRGGTVSEEVDVEVVDDDHTPLPAGEDGRIRLRSPSMGTAYFGDPDLGPFKGFHSGWFYPGDFGRLVDGALVILGREDDLINVAGRKIMPQGVEDALLQFDGVRDAVACAVTDRLGVRQLAIAVVGDPIADPVDFAQRLRRPLGGIQPSIIMRIAEVPRAENGKPKREEVADLLQEQLSRPGPVL